MPGEMTEVAVRCFAHDAVNTAKKKVCDIHLDTVTSHAAKAAQCCKRRLCAGTHKPVASAQKCVPICLCQQTLHACILQERQSCLTKAQEFAGGEWCRKLRLALGNLLLV